MRARQSVRQDVVGARDELRSQTDGERLRPAQDLLSDGVQQRRPGAPLLAEISYCRDVVTVDRHGETAQETELDSKEFSGVYGQRSLVGGP